MGEYFINHIFPSPIVKVGVVKFSCQTQFLFCCFQGFIGVATYTEVGGRGLDREE